MISTLEKGLEYCGKNINLVLGSIAALALVGVIFAGLKYKSDAEEEKAFAALAKIEKSWTDWKTSQDTDKKEAAPKDSNKKSVDPAELYSNLQEFSKKHSHLQAGRLAALMMTEVGMSLSKESEMLTIFEQSFKKSDGQLLSALSVLKKGDLQANQNQCEVAVKTWDQLLSKKKMGFLSDLAHLKSGLCHEKLNQKEKALTHYEAIISAKDSKSDRWASREAQKYKRALEWSQN